MAASGASQSSQTRLSRRVWLAQLSKPLRTFVATEAGSAGMLLAAAALALVWANSPWSDAYTSLWSTEASVRVGAANLSMDLGHWVNDGLMVAFFLVIGLEVRRELSVGELTDRRRVVVPLLAAVGGMVVPALIYLAINPSGEAVSGWGVVIGTDTAFLLGALALVGPSCPTQLRVFLLTITVVDDIVAVTVIGVVYSDSIDLGSLAVAGGCLGVLALMSRRGVWRASAYAVVMVVLWVATVESGLHPSIAGMAAGLLVAAYSPRRHEVEDAASLFRAFRQSPMPEVGYSAKRGLERAVSVNERLQTALHPWAGFVIVPLFALANAGVQLGGSIADALTSPVALGIVAGLIVGKQLGITLFAWLAVKSGVSELPEGIRWRHVYGAGWLAGIGFTMSLFISDLAFSDGWLVDAAKLGILVASLIAGVVGWAILRGASSPR